MIKLTKCQKKGITELKKYLLNNKTTPLVIDGKAGTGKTYLIKELHTIAVSLKKDILYTASSNEAVNQLQYNLPLSTKVRTIQSVLGYRPDNTTLERQLVKKHPAVNIHNYHCILVDEYSALPEVIVEDLQQSRVKVIFVGHSSQLPEVIVNLKNSDRCLPAVCKIEAKTVKLKQGIRNPDKIQTFCDKIEEGITGRYQTPLYYNRVRQDDVWPLVEDNLDSIFKGESCILNWRKATCAEAIRQLRLAWFKTEYPYVKDDIIVFTKPTYIFNGSIGKKSLSQIKRSEPFKATVNSRWIISKVEEAPLFNVLCYRLVISSERLNLVKVTYVPKEEYLPFLYATVLLKKPTPRQIINFHFLCDLFGNVTHNYAITTHRSQGMTIPLVFANYQDMEYCSNKHLKQRLLYVSASRASKELYTF